MSEHETLYVGDCVGTVDRPGFPVGLIVGPSMTTRGHWRVLAEGMRVTMDFPYEDLVKCATPSA